MPCSAERTIPYKVFGRQTKSPQQETDETIGTVELTDA
jgi:hypothetical protein